MTSHETANASVLLTLIVRPALEPGCIEALLEHPAVTGFSATPCRGHGVHPDTMTAAEQVTGSRAELRIELLMDHGAALEVIDALRARLPGGGIHFWILPVLDSGRIEAA